MRTCAKTVLAVAAIALTATQAHAQGGRGMGMGGGAMLLANKGVQHEIKATDEQAGKLDALAEEMGTKQREEYGKLQDLADDERREKMRDLGRAMIAEMHKGMSAILKPEQVERFDQIQTQQLGAAAFMSPRVEKAIKLTADQKSKITDINEEHGRAMRDAREEIQSDREGAMKKMTAARKESAEKAMAVLTDSQKTTWKELTGAPYEVKLEPRP